ncbi:GAF and ANTAR domain-containing protein [Amycolatopsis mongoliensis]|uniref:GAF and ANTAR domain-containing protein n=1 Tax=Amycolatopsis mongoliensis TaxID=715475 RepID=A0A9Y2JHY5_9PSEU|nr:GAF and ANTAR domain-containing protein [Amycolatopsis sp. 4-36]WIX98812.1 GAF and ANTAR domain-containing protein [Amycolatopsis sp. 4-36]
MSTIRDEWGENSSLGRLWATLTALAGDRGRAVSVEFACAVAAERFGSEAACLIVTGKTGVAELHSAIGDLGRRIPEVEVTVGEGPIRDALELASPVIVTDLDAEPVLRRWPLFASLAAEAGAKACFAFPLAVGVVRAGVLVLLHGAPIVPGSASLREALVFADLVLAMLLGEQVARSGTVAGPAPDGFPIVGPEVHQATGMVAAQLDTDPDTAFARLRARAFADGRRLSEVAADVVARRLRFTPDPDPR